MQKEGGLQQSGEPGAQEELEAVGHRTLKMNNACSAVDRCSTLREQLPAWKRKGDRAGPR